jgi:putative oxidoreductase
VSENELNLGLLLLRLALGPMLIVHGLNKVLGSGGLAGTQGWFASLGLRPAWLHARVAPANEIGAGVLMTLGLLNGLAAMAYVGLMLVATFTDHRGKGYFVFKGGWEYTVLIAMVAVAIAALGPGEWSLDHVLGFDLAGAGWAGAALVGGATSAAILMLVSYRPHQSSAD